MLNFSYKKIRICKSSYERMNNVNQLCAFNFICIIKYIDIYYFSLVIYYK